MEGDNAIIKQNMLMVDLKEINEFLTTVKNPVENTDHVGNIEISSNTENNKHFSLT